MSDTWCASAGLQSVQGQCVSHCHDKGCLRVRRSLQLDFALPWARSNGAASCSRRDVVRNGKQDDLLALAELHGCKVVWHDDIQRYIRAYFRQFDAELHKVAPPLTITPHKFLTVVDTSGEYQPLVHVRTSGLLFLLAFLLCLCVYCLARSHITSC